MCLLVLCISVSCDHVTPGWWSYQPQISEDAKNISAEAPVNLNNAWEPTS